jgi:acetate kinase
MPTRQKRQLFDHLVGAGSLVGLHVIPTDEELMIARHTLAVLATEPIAESARR